MVLVYSLYIRVKFQKRYMTLKAKNMTQNSPLWTPRHPEKTDLASFIQFCGQDKLGYGLDYAKFHDWSIENIEDFWSKLWDFCEVIGDKGDVILQNGDQMPGAQFFPGAQINYTENMLRHDGDAPAMIFRDEHGRERILSFDDVYAQVSLWQQILITAGVQKGDRVAACMPNMPETILACFATASLGAIWSSASPDFGTQGLLDRFGQIEPKVLISVDGYFYGGKEIDCLAKIKDVQAKLENLGQTIIVPFLNDTPDLSEFENTQTVSNLTENLQPQDVRYEHVDFNHPLFIMFSSGTTGIPKCIVHGHGGTLLQHLKEHRLQCDIKNGDRVFYFTTCGWMMWNWLISGIGSGACLLLFDGNPFHPDGNVLWDFTGKHDCTLFGTAAKYIDALKANDVHPKDTHDLSTLRTITSTGSPLVHESFDFVYNHIKQDVHLASISGGTDIVSCFVLGNPISPVYRGEIQGAGLGLAVNVFDDNGKPIPAGAGSGELVCTKPFPCMPVCFWNDEDGARYRKAYFERFENIWHHGDWIERTTHDGLIIHGRSDATLNPGGVRIGTAEIYRQVEQIPQILESIAVGQDHEGDVRVILFVRLKDGAAFTEELQKEIKTKIRTGASPRHVPAVICPVTDIPRTKSGKIVELAVKDIIHGRPVKNVEALANPEALNLYKKIKELA